MKQRTKEEIEAKITELWKDDDYTWEKTNCEIKILDSKVTITLSKMYSAPGLSFKHLSALSDFFETRNINDDDRFNHSGCETCDYGSSYGFTLTIRPDTEDEKFYD